MGNEIQIGKTTRHVSSTPYENIEQVSTEHNRFPRLFVLLISEVREIRADYEFSIAVSE